jgi:hypothetical protein
MLTGMISGVCKNEPSNFTEVRGVFTLGLTIKGPIFNSLSLANRVRAITTSEGRKPRIPSGIEGWAGFLPSAYPPKLDFPEDILKVLVRDLYARFSFPQEK